MGKKHKKSHQRKEATAASLKSPPTSKASNKEGHTASLPPHTETHTAAAPTAHLLTDEPYSTKVSAGSPPRAQPVVQSNSDENRREGWTPGWTNHVPDTGSTSSWPPPNHDDTFGTSLKTVKKKPYLQQQLRKHYADDTDDEHNEQSPLMRANSRESNYSSSDVSVSADQQQQQQPHRVRPSSPPAQRHRPFSLRRAASRASESLPRLDEIRTTTRTWLEWSEANGLHPRVWTKTTAIKASMLAVLITLIVLAFTVFRVQDHVKDILKSLFTIGAGFLFKPFPLALGIVLVGDVFAAVGSFVFGRYIFYDWVKGMMSRHPKFNALDQVIKDDGWKIVVMLRLTPIPFNLITYFFSITSIQLWTVVWATCVGVFPGTCIGIWIGSLIKGLSGIDNPELERKNIVIIAMNVVFIGCCILTLSIFGRRSLRKAMKRLDQHQALTSMDDVEVVIEGAADLIHSIEDQAHVPPSRRSIVIERLATEELEHSGSYHYNHHHHHPRDDLEAGTVNSALMNQDDHRPLLTRGDDDGDDDDDADGGRSSSATVASTAASTQTVTGQAAATLSSPSADASLLDRLKKSKAGDRLSQLIPGRHRHHHTHVGIHGGAPPRQYASSGFTRGEKMTFIMIAVVAVVNLCVCLPLYFHFAAIDG
ncbi:hypothetical protein DFQ27_007471 [Actinomortierella ambigua]|uniref:VTT domain-containing protein n=1 Tax=Actinomortierella ambigua TaxID=1343610 RepID=A0A9P6UBS1_9FUNG|nr:hypothetical protein DFQ27_007471 [Actinomortierella ambigua]